MNESFNNQRSQDPNENPLNITEKDCEYDSLALSSKMGSGEVRKHGLFCGSRLPPVITSEGNSLRLEFLSDNSVQKSGFAAVFFTGEHNDNETLIKSYSKLPAILERRGLQTFSLITTICRQG